MRDLIKYIVIASVVIVFMSSCDKDNTIKITTPNGKHITLELAISSQEREKGLMFRESMEASHGMLFIFPDSQIRRFWMKNTQIPLSIAYLDANFQVVHIADMTPFSLEAVSSVVPAKFAIEMNQGVFDNFGIVKGEIITIPKNLAKLAQ